MPEIEKIQEYLAGKNVVVQLKDETNISLKRVLGLGTAVLIVAGSMIGTGVFKKIVPMAATGLNEIYILAAWVFAGLISLLGAFTVAGLAKVTTGSGGKYEYLRLCFGNFTGFLFGWSNFIIIGSGAVAAISFIFSQSLASFLPVPELFNSLKNISVAHSIYPFANAGIKIISIIIIVALTLFNYRGIKNGAVLNNIVTLAKVFGILFLIFLGIFLSHPSVTPTPARTISPPQGFSLFSIFFSVMLSAFWAYDGFVNVAAISGEIKNPKKNIPLAVITGVSVVIVLYVLVNFAFMKSVPLNILAGLGNGKVAQSGIAMMDSMIIILDNTSLLSNNTGKLYYLARLSPRLQPLAINDKTFEQLKNSGNFRLIKNISASNKIMEYYNTVPLVRLLESINETEFTQYKTAAAKIFNPEIFISVEGNGNEIKRINGNPPLRTTDNELLQELSVFAVYMHGTKKGVLDADEKMKQAGAELIDFLQKEYHLEEK